MKAIRGELSPELEHELSRKLEALAKPGVVFSEPIREGDVTIITATEFSSRKNRFTAHPAAIIIISPDEVEVKTIHNRVRTMGIALAMISVIAWATMLILHPPWRPHSSLLEEVERLIATIHDREPSSRS